MRDYYRELGLSPDATPSQIRDRLNEVDPATAEAIRNVLLIERRRRVYDRTLRTVRRVGRVREKLGLGRTELWDERFSDFTSDSHESQSDDWPIDKTAVAIWSGVLLFVVFLIVQAGSENRTSNSIDRPRPERVQEVDPVSENTEPETSPSPNSGDASAEEAALPSGESIRVAEASEPDLPSPVTPPRTGYIAERTEENLVAPLRIITAGGARHYLVKLVRPATERTVATYFVRAGDTLDGDAPLGTYLFRYASGSTWYGFDDLFGPRTSYYEADDAVTFEIVGNQVSGHEIQLYRQIGGNFETRQIQPTEF